MIAAATQNLASGKMLFNWFDVALVIVIALGVWRGRTNGMTNEILPVTQWLLMILAAAFGYKPVGDPLIRSGIVKSTFGTSISEETVAYIASYIFIAIVVFIAFSFVKRRLKPRLEGSNTFGSSEYYFGMVSGALRFFCILIFVLAILNAPVYTQADIIAAKNFNNRNFGGGLAGYSGDFFPTVSETQTSVFKDSLSGPFLKDNLSLLLINVNRYVPPSSSKTPGVYMGK